MRPYSERERGQSRGAVDEHHSGIKIRGDDEIRRERANEIRSRVVDVDQIRDFVLDQVSSIDGVRGDDRVQRLIDPPRNPRRIQFRIQQRILIFLFFFFFFGNRTEESRDAINLESTRASC